jgi:hypothetical protein
MINYERIVEVYGSKNVEVISYSFESKIMKVRFKNSTEYLYHKVPSSVFGSVISNQDIGKILYSLVSSNPNSFPYERIDI